MRKEKFVTTFKSIWQKLANSKEYRSSYALALLKRSVAFQIKTLRKEHCGSQAELAQAAGITQGVVSRAEDQDYGNLTLNTVGRIAGGLDIAFVGRFVPFSELAKFSLNLSEEEFSNIPTFEEESAAMGAATSANAHTPPLGKMPVQSVREVPAASPFPDLGMVQRDGKVISAWGSSDHQTEGQPRMKAAAGA
jgi:transcriptional regulator with XRE-family HTH domain